MTGEPTDKKTVKRTPQELVEEWDNSGAMRTSLYWRLVELATTPNDPKGGAS